jgi:hypothetical protein
LDADAISFHVRSAKKLAINATLLLGGQLFETAQERASRA